MSVVQFVKTPASQIPNADPGTENAFMNENGKWMAKDASGNVYEKGGSPIDPNPLLGTSDAVVPSQNAVKIAITQLKSDLLAGVPAAYDTLIELFNANTGQDMAITNLLSAVGLRVLISDIADTFTSTETNKPASANRVKLLNDMLTALGTDARLTKETVANTGSFVAGNTINSSGTKGKSDTEANASIVAFVESVSGGNIVKCYPGSKVKVTGLGFAPGQTVFVNSTGALTTTVPTSGIWCKVLDVESATWAIFAPEVFVMAAAITDKKIHFENAGETAGASGIETDGTGLILASRANPGTVPTDRMHLYPFKTANRARARVKTNVSIFDISPAFHSRHMSLVHVGGTNVISKVSTNTSDLGNITTVFDESTGILAKYSTAGTAATAAGSSNASTSFLRGSVAGGSNGFWFHSRVALQDASYNQTGAATGSRAFVGLSSSTGSQVTGVDDYDTNRCGFVRLHTDTGRQDTNWRFSCRALGGSETLVDTGVVLTIGKAYDFVISCDPVGAIIYWEIWDWLTGDLLASGNVNTNLPVATTPMRGIVYLTSVDAVVRSISFHHYHIESK